MIQIIFNTQIEKVGKKYQIIIPSILISKIGFHEGEVLELTVNGKDMKVEKSIETENSEDIAYPIIVFSDS